MSCLADVVCVVLVTPHRQRNVLIWSAIQIHLAATPLRCEQVLLSRCVFVVQKESLSLHQYTHLFFNCPLTVCDHIKVQ